MLGGDRHPGAIEDFERVRLLAHLRDASLERLVERQQPGFEGLALGDVVNGSAQQPNLRVFPADLALSRDPVESAIEVADAELDVEAAGAFCRFGRGVDLLQVVGEDGPVPCLQRAFRRLGVKSEEGRGARAPIPFALCEVELEGRDPARRFPEPKPLLRGSGSFDQSARVTLAYLHPHRTTLRPQQDRLGLAHRPKLAERDVPWKVIEPAGTRDEGLLGQEPFMRPDPFGDLLAGLHIRRLHVDGTDAELLVAEQAFIVIRHVMLDQIGVAIDPANKIGLVAAHIEIAVPDLTVVIGPHRIIALADVDEDMTSSGRSSIAMLITSTAAFTSSSLGGRKIRLVDLDVLAAGLRELLEVLVQELAEVLHHATNVVVIFVIGHRREEMRPGHGDLHRLSGEGRDRPEFLDEAEIDRVLDRPPADSRGVKDIGVVSGDGLRLCFTTEGGNLLPEIVEHRVRRRMTIVRPAMHLPAGDHIDAGDLLLEDGSLCRPQLRIGEIPIRRAGPSRRACPTPRTSAARYALRRRSS